MRGWWSIALLLAYLGLLPFVAVAQDVPGTARSRYHGLVPITSEPSGGQYRLKQTARNIQVHDKRFGNGRNDVTNPTADWSQRYTLSQLNITSIGTAWQDQEDPGGANGPDLELRLCTATGTVVRSLSLPWPLPSSFDIEVYNLVVHPGLRHLLIVDDDLNGDDTLAYVALELATNQESIGGWPNGVLGTISKLEGDAAVDAYWCLNQAYDYFNMRWGWSPSASFQFLCPTSSGRVDGDINVQLTGLAAEADPDCNDIAFGMGGGAFGPYVSLDVVAHEYAHFVIGMSQTGVGLAGIEGLALNEAFADMMGAIIERHIYMTGLVDFVEEPDHWTVGEHVKTGGLRNIDEPTVQVYGDSAYWSEVAAMDKYDVAGVAERWFYLLVQGGSGMVNGSPYNVTGIGWENAADIIFYSMTDALFTASNAAPTYSEAAYATLVVANELFPGTSIATSVQQAWHAVGLMPSPSSGCLGESTWVGASGSFSDGSGAANYGNLLDCDWLIKPIGADEINIYFTQFSVSAGDTLYIHVGESVTGPVLAKYSGSSVPQAATFNTGAITVRFLTNSSGNSSGWTLSYSAGTTSYCSSATAPFTAASGSFTDGSGASSYASNTHCGWYIAPPGATSITLSFSAFNTETGADLVKVYDGLNTTVPPLYTFSGFNLPTPVTVPSGSLFVEFVTNSSVQGDGWSASYTSTGTVQCNGTTVLNGLTGSISDGSGSNNYQNNLSCGWLIQPAGAAAVELSFTAFNLEGTGTYGQVYDAVRVYDGIDASAPLLGTFTGNSLPANLVSSGPALYIQFITDNATTGPGWSANYTGLTGSTCSGTQVLIASSGSFEDGSGAGEYANNAVCNWLIQPEDAYSITLSFTAFATQLNADGVVVYDGPSTSAPILGFFTGGNLPPALTSSGGSMLVRFISDASVGAPGFVAQYQAVVIPPGPPAIVGYEYWFDEADGDAAYEAVPPTTHLLLDETLSTEAIEPGGHMLHIRFKYINGLWSSVLSRPFLKTYGAPNSSAQLIAMEYWFDEAVAQGVTVPLSGQQVNLDVVLGTDGLTIGGHTLHMRFLSNAGWSSVLSRPFFQGPIGTSDARIDGYEYWFDEEVDDAESASIAPVAELNLSDILPTDELPTGLHVLHIRFHGTGGWSSVLTRPFFRAGAGANLPNLIAGYRYWFDDADANAVDVSLPTPQSPYNLAVDIPTNSLAVGAHTFHIQFVDIGGNWGAVLSQAFTRAATPTVTLPLRVLLDGPYDPATQWMQDSLRANGLIPLTEPFTNAGFLQVGEGGGESIAAAVLSSTGANAIVDWVLVEVRSATNSAQILNTRAALVQRDGDVVDLDGVSPLTMSIANGNYHVAIRHRNHLGVMTLSPVMLSGTSTLLDFTSSAFATYGTEARKNVNGKMLLWSGEVVRDRVVKYAGASNDRDAVLVRIGGAVPTAVTIGYFSEDVTLDGVVKYSGAANDRDRILIAIGGSVPTAVRVEQLP